MTRGFDRTAMEKLRSLLLPVVLSHLDRRARVDAFEQERLQPFLLGLALLGIAEQSADEFARTLVVPVRDLSIDKGPQRFGQRDA